MQFNSFCLKKNPNKIFLKELKDKIEKYRQDKLSQLNVENEKEMQAKMLDIQCEVEQYKIDLILSHQKEYKDNESSNNRFKKTDYSKCIFNQKNNSNKKLINNSFDKITKRSLIIQTQNKFPFQIISENRQNDKKIIIETFRDNDIINKAHQNLFDPKNDLLVDFEQDELQQVEIFDENLSIQDEEIERNIGKNDIQDIKNQCFIVVTLILLQDNYIDYNLDKTNINLISFFKLAQNQRKIPFDLQAFNYNYYFENGKFADGKICYDKNMMFYLRNNQQYPNQNYQQYNINIQTQQLNRKKHNTIKQDQSFIIQDQISSYFAGSILQNNCIKSSIIDKSLIQQDLYKDIFDIQYSEEQDFFNIKLQKGQKGTFFYLDQQFQDQILLQEGIIFLVNQNQGFYVEKILTKDQTQQKIDLITQNFQDIDFFPMNLKFQKTKEFLEYIQQLSQTYPINQTQKLINQYFKQYLLDQKEDILVLNFIQYYNEYNIYKVKKKCLLFNYKQQSDFFDQNLKSFLFGKTFYKMMKELKFNGLNEFSIFNINFDFYIQYDQDQQIYRIYYNVGSQITHKLFNQNYSGLKFQQNFQQTQGFWIGTFLFNIFSDEFQQNVPFCLPYGTYIMSQQNVFRIDKTELVTIFDKQFFKNIYKLQQLLNKYKKSFLESNYQIKQLNFIQIILIQLYKK